MPDWVTNMFVAEYNNMDAEWTFGWLMNKSVLVPQDELDLEEDEVDALGVTADQLLTMATTIATDINTSIVDGTIFNELKAQIQNFHTIKAKTDPLTDEEIAFLAEFPTIAGEIFPADFASTMTLDTPMSNMGQLFLILGYLDIYDGVLSDMITEQLRTLLGDAVMYDAQISFLGEKLFADNGGEFIMEMYSPTEIAAYDIISISRINGSSETLWDEDTFTQITALRINTNLSSIGWDVGGVAFPEDEVTGTLTYPKADGTTATVALTYNSDWREYALEPQNCDFSGCSINEDQIVSDFVSGDYTVTFTYDGETYTKTEALFFVPDANQYMARLTTPEGMPQWDNAWDNLDWAVLSTNTEYLAFEEANTAYWSNGVQSFAPNVDANGDDVNDTLEGMVIRWEAPDLTGLVLPENIEVAYNVSVRLFAPVDFNHDGEADWEDCQDDWNACNIDIYNTWNDDRTITTTSITLPVGLEVNEDGANYDLSVDVMFVDRNTGREVAHGGWSNAQFRVGESLALTGAEVITFRGTVEVEEYEDYTAEIPATMKVALYSEEWGEEDGEWYNRRTKVADGDYNATSNTFSISITSAVLDANIGMNKNLQVIGFDDQDSDGLWDDWDAATEDNDWYSEASYWLQNWMWIDTWGDTTIHVGNEDDETSIRLVTGEDAEVDGLVIKIW